MEMIKERTPIYNIWNYYAFALFCCQLEKFCLTTFFKKKS